MPKKVVVYKINKAKNKDVLEHLIDCNDLFIPPLNQGVEIKIYAQKISTKAETFEAWHKSKLIGLIAAYCNDTPNKRVYITNVSVMKNFSNKGIASKLLEMCIEHAKSIRFNEITLKVNSQSEDAKRLYKKYNFQETGMDGEFISMRRKTK